MADRRLPQFALPWTVPTSVIKVTYATAGQITYNLTSPGTRYNARSTTASLDALAWVFGEIHTADTGSASWVIGDLTGSYTGVAQIVNTRLPGAGDVRGAATEIEFTSGLTGADFGFTSNTVTASPSGTFTATYRRKYLWTPDPDGIPLLAFDEARPLTSNVRTTAPDGTTTLDFYGSMSERQVAIVRMDAANVYSCYATDADYAAKVGNNIADPNAAFEGLVADWASLGASSVRYWPDRSDLTTYVDLVPGENGGEWLGDLPAGFSEASPRPHRFDCNLSFVVVPS